MAKRARRRGRRKALVVTTVLGALAAGGILFVGGALAAHDAVDPDDGLAAVTTSTSTTLAPATTTTTSPTTTTTTVPPAAADGTLEAGEDGDEVHLLQARLTDLGFWLGQPDGGYGQLTRQAVMAFQKANGLSRDGVAGPATLAALETATRPVPADPSGTHVEIDLARQILLIVQEGQAQWVLNTSTGNGEAYAAPGGGTAVAATPTGSFVVQREIDGLRRAPLGTLYRPKYFHGGFAIHGAGSIPAHPASHGCARVTNAAMDLLWSSGVTAIGTPVVIY